jgi:hypothetical protein
MFSKLIIKMKNTENLKANVEEVLKDVTMIVHSVIVKRHVKLRELMMKIIIVNGDLNKVVLVSYAIKTLS